MASPLVNGKHLYLRCHSAQQSYMSAGAGTDFVTPEINAIARMGWTGPRFDPNPSTIEPAKGGGRTWTSIDAYVARILAAGLTKCQVGLYYGATGSGWSTVDGKNPLAADNSELKSLYFALLDRLVAQGLAITDITAQLWNEWDGPVGGGDGVNANANVKQWLEYFAPLLVAAYPTLRVIGPSYQGGGNSVAGAGMVAANVDSTFKSTVQSHYPASCCWSFYPVASNMPLNYTPSEFALVCRETLDANVAALEALDPQVVGQDMHISESGLTQSRLGFTTSSWLKHGGVRLLAEYDAQMICACLDHPRIKTVSWYDACNNASGDDARSSGTNYGVLNFASQLPYKERYLALGRLAGNPMVEATELAFWGAWAPEPTG